MEGEGGLLIGSCNITTTHTNGTCHSHHRKPIVKDALTFTILTFLPRHLWFADNEVNTTEVEMLKVRHCDLDHVLCLIPPLDHLSGCLEMQKMVSDDTQFHRCLTTERPAYFLYVSL